MKDLLKDLNKEQLQAVTHKTGPLLIIAGAGTGKTKVITHRIAWLIEQKLAKPSEILALTFTEKAAAEMEERVDILVPYGFVDTWISTFHAFGDRMLRDYAIDLGLPTNFKVLTPVEQAIFLKQNLYAFDLKHFRPVSKPTSHIEALIKHFSRLKDELIASETYLSFAQTQNSKLKTQNDSEKILQAEKTLELANAYQRYQDLMIQAGNLDFGDQIFLTYKLLKENPRVLKECQKKFKYILVDEFQDTNYAQNELVKLLAQKHQNITVVGDDDQAIYRFRGASISNILDFKKTYPNAKEIVLNHNYRSTQKILDASYKLILHNNPDRLEKQNKINKKLLSPRHGAKPELLYCQTLSVEADSVVQKIINLKSKILNLKFNDFAILVRANSQAQPFIEALNLQGIPNIFSGSSSLFQQPEIKMLIAFLKCLAYTDDNLSFYQLASSDIYNIDHQIMSELHTLSKRSNRNIFDLISQSASLESKSEFASATGNPASSGRRDAHVERSSFTNKRADLSHVIYDISKYRSRKNDSVGELLYDYLSEKKYLKKLLQHPSIENEIKIINIAKFFDRISNFIHSATEKGVLAFLENLEMILEFGEEVVTSDIDPDLDAVNILTVHAAKGLEWPVVIIINAVSDRFPSRSKREPLPIAEELIKERLPEGDFHLQEERRLFYVAATRAKDYLYISAAEDYGGKRAKKISPFVLEFLDEANPEKLKHKLSAMEKIQRFQKITNQAIKLPDKFTGKVIKLSRAQIDDYHTCPKKFYFAHILKIPLLENYQLMYGTAIHSALNHYFLRKIRRQKTTLEQLLQDYQQAFRNVGFISIQHERDLYKNGLETLTRFFQQDQKETITPTSVEEVFEFQTADVKINGRFDLVYPLCDSLSKSKKMSGSLSYEIRDFKTSDVRSQKDADRRIKESTQMMIYALAWQNQHGIIPKTTLYFIESGLKGEAIFSQKDLDKTQEMIQNVSAGLKNHNFSAQPDYFSCQYCPYTEICPDSISK